MSQEANVHDACLSSISQRQPMCQEDDIPWRTTVKIKTQTTAIKATSGMAASSQRGRTALAESAPLHGAAPGVKHHG